MEIKTIKSPSGVCQDLYTVFNVVVVVLVFEDYVSGLEVINGSYLRLSESIRSESPMWARGRDDVNKTRLHINIIYLVFIRHKTIFENNFTTTPLAILCRIHTEHAKYLFV